MARLKLWHKVRKYTQIQWTRLESWSSFGTPDLLGSHDNCGFFMVELKIATGKYTFTTPKLFHLTKQRNFILIEEASSSSIKLYESSSILVTLQTIVCLPRNGWLDLYRALLIANRWTLEGLPACQLARLWACRLEGSRACRLAAFGVLSFASPAPCSI